MDRRAGFGIVIFLLFIFLAVAIVLLMIFLHGSDELIVSARNSSVNEVFFNITIRSNALFRVDYVLFNGSFVNGSFLRDVVLVDGVLFPDLIEEFKGVRANSTLLLGAFSGEYYYNDSLCNVSRNKMSCSVSLSRKANNYSISLSPSSVIIEPFGGVLQSPILCWAESGNVVNVKMNLSLYPVPKDLKYSMDFCYAVGHDISRKTSFPINIIFSEYERSEMPLKVLCRDSEVKGYQNIGDKESGLLVGGS